MAHRQAKVKAFELFSNNLWPPDVAAQLKINIRTAQRWFIEWKTVNVADSQTPDPSANIAVESRQVIDQTPHLSTLKAKGVSEWSSDWEQMAIALSDELLLHHGKIRRKLSQMLAEETQKSDVNTRVLTTLSQSICRHSEIEISVANLSLLNLDRAFKVLDSYGYIVINPADAESERS